MGIIRPASVATATKATKTLAKSPASPTEATDSKDRDRDYDKPVPVDSITDAKVRRRVSTLCAEIREMNDEIAALEAAKKGLTEQLTDIGTKAKLGKVVGDGWLLLPPYGRKTLKKELLLEQGVTVEQIELATVEEPGRNYSVRKST